MKLYDQCVKLYEGMMDQSDLWKDGDHGQRVYEGYITDLADELGIGTSAYTTVVNRLVAMGCLEKILTGKRGVPSRWSLIQHPTLERFESSRGPTRSRIRALSQRVQELEARLDEHLETAEQKRAVCLPTLKSKEV